LTPLVSGVLPDESTTLKVSLLLFPSIRKSVVDYGASWNPTNALTSLPYWDIVIAADGVNIAAVVYNDGVYDSTYGGITWVRSPSLPSGTGHS